MALQLWSLVERESQKSKDMSKSQFAAAMQQEIEKMKSDYSDAIILLESKLESVHQEINSYREAIDILRSEKEVLKTEVSVKEKECKELSEKSEQLRKDRSELEKALEHCHLRIEETKKVELETREKLIEAVSMAQEALNNESQALAEKERLENAMADLIEEAGKRVGNEVELVKKELTANVTSLSDELKKVSKEKRILETKLEREKLEWQGSIHQVKFENETLSTQLKEEKEKRKNEVAQLLSEREILRNEILTLLAALEHLPSIVGSGEGKVVECEKCSGLERLLQKYKQLAEKYMDIATNITEEYETAIAEERKKWKEHCGKLLSHQCHVPCEGINA